MLWQKNQQELREYQAPRPSNSPIAGANVVLIEPVDEATETDLYALTQSQAKDLKREARTSKPSKLNWEAQEATHALSLHFVWEEQAKCSNSKETLEMPQLVSCGLPVEPLVRTRRAESSILGLPRNVNPVIPKTLWLCM